MRTRIVAIVALTTLVLQHAAIGSEPNGRSAIVDRFLTSGAPALASYRARRTLEASTRGGKMSASLDAWTWLTPEGTFCYEVIAESGSSLIRQRVLRAALDAEARSRNERDSESAALTPANYAFTLEASVEASRIQAAGGTGLARIGLAPRRTSQMLINGTATVTSDTGDLRLVEGRLAKSPSFWTLHVDVTRQYERIAGVRVPVSMRSRADVRIVGESRFSMRYDYETINGTPVR